MEAKLFLSK